MRVGLASIENWIKHILDVGNIQLGSRGQRVRYPIYGLIPPSNIPFSGMTLLESNCVLLEVRPQLGISVEVDQPFIIPWIDEVMTGPPHFSDTDISDQG